MRKSLKKVLATGLAATMALSMTACSSGSTATTAAETKASEAETTMAVLLTIQQLRETMIQQHRHHSSSPRRQQLRAAAQLQAAHQDISQSEAGGFSTMTVHIHLLRMTQAMPVTSQRSLSSPM